MFFIFQPFLLKFSKIFTDGITKSNVIENVQAPVQQQIQQHQIQPTIVKVSKDKKKINQKVSLR